VSLLGRVPRGRGAHAFWACGSDLRHEGRGSAASSSTERDTHRPVFGVKAVTIVE